MAHAKLSAINSEENHNPYSNEVAAPGVKKDNFIINYDNGLMTISLRIGRIKKGRNSHPP